MEEIIYQDQLSELKQITGLDSYLNGLNIREIKQIFANLGLTSRYKQLIEKEAIVKVIQNTVDESIRQDRLEESKISDARTHLPCSRQDSMCVKKVENPEIPLAIDDPHKIYDNHKAKITKIINDEQLSEEYKLVLINHLLNQERKGGKRRKTNRRRRGTSKQKKNKSRRTRSRSSRH